jgi:hypothetical protein
MIINKDQGQSLKEVGTDLKEECFLHVWLFQKMVLQKGLYILVPTGKTTIYKEVLCWIFIIGMYNTSILKNN